MKQDKVQSSIFEAFQLPSKVPDNESEASQSVPLDRTLRTLGSLLEQDGFSEFDLQLCDDVYVVRGQASAEQSGLLSLFRKMFGLGPGRHGSRPILRSLRFSISGMLSAESKLRELRKQSSEMPHPYSLPQILRGVGCYLDKREGSRLVGVEVKTAGSRSSTLPATAERKRLIRILSTSTTIR